jgi:two-component system, OmpR family, sensor histidine kinase BaeS
MCADHFLRRKLMKLVYKLFAIIIITGMPIFFLTVGGMYYFTSKHFANYVAKEEVESLTSICEALQVEYRQHNSWDYIRENRLLWDQIIYERQAQNNDDLPRRSRTPSKGMPKYEDPTKPLPPPAPILARRLTLYDGQKGIVLSWTDNPQDQDFREIVVGGSTVGWLGLARSKSLKTPLQLHFILEQIQTLVFISVSILILAAFTAFVLSRHLLEPIQRLAAAAHALAFRHFETRVAVNSSDELGALSEDFNTMAITLERHEYMHRQWIADISHELRTPLTVLRGEIEAVLDGLHDMKRKTMECMYYEVMLLLKLINDLHTLTIIESEALTINKEQVDVFALTDSVLTLFHTRFSEKGIEVQGSLSTSGMGITMGDPDRLAQVFINLFENSLQYTDSPGKICIRGERKDGFLSICIEDSAPSVPASALPLIFDRLYRTDHSRSRKKGGSGLGLSIAKAIVESHNGKITASLSPLGGLQIDITFPLVIDG